MRFTISIIRAAFHPMPKVTTSEHSVIAAHIVLARAVLLGMVASVAVAAYIVWALLR